MVAPLRSVPQRFLVAGLKAALLGGGVLSGLETAGAALFMGGGGYVGWVVGVWRFLAAQCGCGEALLVFVRFLPTAYF